MQKALQLSWRGIPPSEAIEGHVRDEVERLERYFGRIVGCAVTLDAPSRHHRHGAQQYRVRIELAVPGGTLVVSRDRARNQANADLYVAIRAAFREAKRRLQDHARRLESRVKVHEGPPRAVVAVVMPNHGFLRTADGREIYFHERSVLGGSFARLRAGDLVRFAEEPGDEGPQASTVERLRAHAEAVAP